jgi:hypothetical protein
MKSKEIIKHLEDRLDFARNEVNALHIMDTDTGKKIYGSIAEFKQAKSIWAGKVMELYDVINYIKYQNLK